MLSRRLFLQGGAGVLAAPWITRGSPSSSLAEDLVRESTVIDMLGLLTLDFKKLDTWRTRPASFHLSDFQRLKGSGITVFHPAVGDIYAESSADISGWDAFIDSYPQYFIRVCDPADVARAKAEGKLGIIVGQQNSNHFRTVDDVDASHRTALESAAAWVLLFRQRNIGRCAESVRFPASTAAARRFRCVVGKTK